jgi:hypothetical protein
VELEWDVHYTTVLDIMQSFLVNGLLKTTDEIKPDLKAEVRSLSNLPKYTIDMLLKKIRQICSYLADWEIQNF